MLTITQFGAKLKPGMTITVQNYPKPGLNRMDIVSVTSGGSVVIDEADLALNRKARRAKRSSRGRQKA